MEKALTELSDQVSWMEERLGKNSLNEVQSSNIQQISTWTDMEHIQAPTKEWLSRELGQDLSSENKPEGIAQGMNNLRIKSNLEAPTKLVTKRTTGRQLEEIFKIDFQKQINYSDGEKIIMDSEVLKVRTIIESIKVQDQKITEVEANKAVRIVLSVFEEILQKIENTEEGNLRIGGLGIFKVRTAEATQGKKKGHMVKKVFFIPKSGS